MKILKYINDRETLLLGSSSILVKLPEHIYQVFYDHALMNPNKEQVKRAIFRDLKEWVADNYPDYGIIHFEDYSTAEAEEASKKTGIHITWGLYLVLAKGADMRHYSPVRESLPDIIKTIENGNKQT